MYSLSVLAKMRGWRFEYYVDHISSFLEQNPHGNLKKALQNSMQIKVAKVPTEFDSNVLFVQEGGRIQESYYGISILSSEIAQWMQEQNINNLNIFLPSGTGTTALFMSKYFTTHRINATVYTTSCVGGSEYLKKQFYMLEAECKYHPVILEGEYKHHFGKLYKQEYEMWQKLLNQTNIEFDLLYDPYGWIVMMQHIQTLNSHPLLYIHQGGILGNESMLPRYERKYAKV
jgi:1-aminocyclopropane-1-carboxylate deaminase/D-cysteine desulfhydrase-like pyridoxal-dependent ACC family enzyme